MNMIIGRGMHYDQRPLNPWLRRFKSAKGAWIPIQDYKESLVCLFPRDSQSTNIIYQQFVQIKGKRDRKLTPSRS